MIFLLISLNLFSEKKLETALSVLFLSCSLSAGTGRLSFEFIKFLNSSILLLKSS